MTRQEIVNLFLAERERQTQLGNDTTDNVTHENDWVAYITAYLGRASAGVYRNERENQTFRDNLVKVGALTVAALEAIQ